MALVAQRDTSSDEKQFLAGPGFGLDHGGIGLRVDGRLTPGLGFIAGAGFNTATIGWNLGLLYRFMLSRPIRPYASIIYGYNLAVRYESGGGRYVSGTNYYGPTVGAGVEFWTLERHRFLHLGLLVPIRTEEARAMIGKSWPVLPTIGMHF
ncbi:MAG: hypothetical protein KF905_09050 [Flavobacteriales bacterium]|nr:hypothetical protein [Flavobacteriales bacterium]